MKLSFIMSTMAIIMLIIIIATTPKTETMCNETNSAQTTIK